MAKTKLFSISSSSSCCSLEITSAADKLLLDLINSEETATVSQYNIADILDAEEVAALQPDCLHCNSQSHISICV